MAEVTLNTVFQLKRGLSADWARVNPVLADGEPGFELDTGKLKIGRNSTPWNNLDYLNEKELKELKSSIQNFEILLGNVYTKEEVDALIRDTVSPASYKGEVDSYEDLDSIVDPAPGDIYSVADEDNQWYIWDGAEWDKYDNSIDLSGYVTDEEIIPFTDIVESLPDNLLAGAPVVEISDSKVNLEFSAYKKEEETDTYYKSEEPFKVEIDLTDLIGKSFIYSQEEPSNIWSIEHNLNKYPNVQIFDSNDNMTFGEIKHIDKNNLTIRFSAAIGGKAYLG